MPFIQFLRFIVPVLALLLSNGVRAEVSNSSDPQTGLQTWEWRDSGVSLQLVQRTPDQTRAFFQGRGFSNADADKIAKACVFQSIFRNDGELAVSYDLTDWRVSHNGEESQLHTRERWAEVWQQGNSTQAARIAFQWSLLPSRQIFEPGDYNWGMISFGLLPEASFDLVVVVSINQQPVTVRIPHIVCTSD